MITLKLVFYATGMKCISTTNFEIFKVYRFQFNSTSDVTEQVSAAIAAPPATATVCIDFL
jgi:hypothetical protein